jgi:hypothetical protein
MRSLIVLATTLMFVLSGCNDEKAAERENANAEHATEYQAEIRLMSDLAKASPELERRVAEWISSEDGVLFILDDSGEPSFTLHAMPALTPWHVSCNEDEIELTLGSWEEGKDRNAKLLTRSLSFANFSKESCKVLAGIVARKMMQITAPTRSR